VGWKGVVIRDVQPGSTADRAGLRSIRVDRQGRIFADVVIGVDGREVEGFADLANLLDAREPGDTVVLTVVRGEDVIPIEMKLERLPSRRR
jgi:S1-C subfamily serine protease